MNKLIIALGLSLAVLGIAGQFLQILLPAPAVYVLLLTIVFNYILTNYERSKKAKDSGPENTN